jgi:hypothetical protein
MVPVGGIGANAQTATPPNATSGAGGGVSSSARCVGAMSSTAGNTGATGFFGGIGGC